mgnify:CR=1 FL=1
MNSQHAHGTLMTQAWGLFVASITYLPPSHLNGLGSCPRLSQFLHSELLLVANITYLLPSHMNGLG